MAAAGHLHGQELEELSDQMEKLKLELKKELREELKEELREELKEELREELKKEQKKQELKKLQQHEVDLTLDPATAHPKLILSGDGKQVQLGDEWQNVQDSPRRFNHSLNVLAKQSFSEGRFYFEVQVRGKTGWTIGVAKKSINRKGAIAVAPGQGFWAIRMKKENEYEACAGPPDKLPPRRRPEKVGVFVDYEKGLVSFYDADTADRICQFNGFRFTERLYPYFSPGPSDNGRNSNPLVITPVRK